MSRQDDIKQLITQNQRRLQIRNEQKAKFGINAPPEILIEIDDITAEIKRLQTELEGSGLGNFMTTKKVLVVFANPRGTSPLRLGSEDRVIRESVKLSHYRENISLTIHHATTVHDLRRALLDEEFQIIHISGHGTGSGLVLEDDLGGKYVIPQQALAELFKAYSPPIECVILNACYSISQGQLTSMGIPFTIAMEGPISDNAALEFSRGFYDAIGAGKNIDFAYEEGCRTVKLAAPNQKFISQILRKGEKSPIDSNIAEFTGQPDVSSSFIQSQKQAIEITKHALAILEQQAAGYTSLTMPVHLQIELDDKRKELARLEDALSLVLQSSDHSTPEQLRSGSIGMELSSRSDNEIHSEEVKALVGLAIDLSGSMATSIRNNTGGQISRLESFRQSLERLASEAKTRARESRGKQLLTSIDLFAYGFGLRTMNVCDLLSLIKIGRDVITEEEIEELKQKYIREMQSNYSGYAGLGDLAKQFGFGGLVREAERTVRANAEAEIRRKIMLEIKRRLERQLQNVGDTTMPIEEIAQLWESSGETLANAEELIFGNTPMRECLFEMAKRFEREIKSRSKDTTPVLFILSDGEPTDGDPLPVLDQLKALGITIISCFVTDQDIANPRILFGEPEPQWSKGAKLMFDLATTVEDDSVYAKFLLRKNWIIQPDARLFVQVNHSTILEEFIRVVISPFESSSSVSNLPIGI